MRLVLGRCAFIILNLSLALHKSSSNNYDSLTQHSAVHVPPPASGLTPEQHCDSLDDESPARCEFVVQHTLPLVQVPLNFACVGAVSLANSSLCLMPCETNYTNHLHVQVPLGHLQIMPDKIKTCLTCITLRPSRNMDHEPEEMAYQPDIRSPFLGNGKETLSLEALSTLRVMAFLDPRNLYKNLFEPLRQLFLVKNEELMFNFPTTAAAHNKACAELVEVSLIQLNKEDKALSMRLETQTSVLADMQPTGLISPLFNAMVKALIGL